jgi:hypothetical protein
MLQAHGMIKTDKCLIVSSSRCCQTTAGRVLQPAATAAAGLIAETEDTVVTLVLLAALGGVGRL